MEVPLLMSRAAFGETLAPNEFASDSKLKKTTNPIFSSALMFLLSDETAWSLVELTTSCKYVWQKRQQACLKATELAVTEVMTAVG